MAEPIPFANQQASGLETLAGAGAISMNVVSDAAGAVRRRPGIRAYSEAPDEVVNSQGIIGLFCTDDGRLLALSGGSSRALYEVQNGAAHEVQNSLPGDRRPVFAQTEMLVAIAGGSNIAKYVRATRAASILGGNPPFASHVIAHASRLLANDLIVDTTAVRYSATFIGNTSLAGAEYWPFAPPGGYIIAEARPDPVVAVAENTNEVFVFGASTLQVYGTDANAVYLPVATREVGCLAPYSVIKQEQAFAWLDDKRRFVVSDGREFKPISSAIDGTLDEIETVSDCFGYRVVQGSLECLVWTFPTDGRTFAWQVGGGWGQWSSWDRGRSNFGPLNIAALHLRTDTNVNVVGTRDGFVAELSRAALTDLGEPIQGFVETGYLSRGTDRIKHCQCVRLVLRRGQVLGAVGPHAWLSYRDQPGPWSGRIAIDLGGSKDTHPVLEFRSLGTYRRRQWRFEFTGPEELVLAAASEDFEVLE